jgi:small-conductance mechanosensitive channel
VIFNIQNIFYNLIQWAVSHSLMIVGIFLGAFILSLISKAVITGLVRKAVRSHNFKTREAEKKREETLIIITDSTVKFLIWVVASLMILSEVGVDIAPLLAAVGVAGIAVGFGGQYLIRDIVSGIFIILENQYRVGDVACLDDTCGVVEDITIRKTRLRDLDGVVHNVPHGSVTKTSNLSNEYARVNLDIGISYSSDLEKVIKVVNKTGLDMSKDPDWEKDILKPVSFERVEDFADSAIIIKLLGDTQPLRQWAVAGEYRKRIKIAFDKAGIELPFPQRVIHQASK